MKYVFTGPESSGKTTMATWLSSHLGLFLVKEQARDYLDGLGRAYTYEHVREIGLLQLWEEHIASTHHQDFVSDTDLLTIIIWQMEKYGQYDASFFQYWSKSEDVFYFLCTPDILWEYDPLRENPHDRTRLFEIYLDYLKNWQKPFIILNGTQSQRISQVKAALKATLLR